MQQFLEILKTIAIVGGMVGVFIAIGTYRANCLHQKVDRLTNLRKRYWDLMFTEMESGKFMMALLPHGENDDGPARIPSIHRQHLLGFFKEVGILVQEGAIDKVHAFYLFAYFATQCEENNAFWEGLNRDTIFWRPFFEFVKEMREVGEAEMAKAR